MLNDGEGVVDGTGDLGLQTGWDIGDPVWVGGGEDDSGEEGDGVGDGGGLDALRDEGGELGEGGAAGFVVFVESGGVGFDVGDGVERVGGQGDEGLDDARGYGGQVGWFGGFSGEQLDVGGWVCRDEGRDGGGQVALERCDVVRPGRVGVEGDDVGLDLADGGCALRGGRCEKMMVGAEWVQSWGRELTNTLSMLN